MKLVLEMDLNNAAYREYAEYPNEGELETTVVANDLRNVAEKIELGYKSGTIIDYNGNKVGTWQIENDDEDSDEDADDDEDEDDPYERTGYESEAEGLLMDIAESLDMPYEDDDPGSYDEWNYISLLHDYNNGRGDEWIDTFVEEGLDQKLLHRFKQLIGRAPLDRDDSRLKEKYDRYVKYWKKEHKGPEYEGTEPACFDEWYDNEYSEDFDEDDDEDENN